MAGPQANIANFFAPLRGPGRSAATLIEDLILFDPRQHITPGCHLLEDGARSFGQVQFISDALPEGTCVHDFLLKNRQSAPPQVDERASSESVWQVAAICLKCRMHLLLTVDYTAAWQEDPCPNWTNPLHHFVRSKWRQEAAYRDLQREGLHSVEQVHIYECSAQRCSAIVTIRLIPPVMPNGAIQVLVDKQYLAKRTDAAFDMKAGHTEGMKRPSPIDVLIDLRAYIRNSWTKNDPAEIGLDNKRFVVRFGPEGQPCRKVLELLKFELKPGVSWVVPQPVADDTTPLQNPHNIFLDNVEAELNVLIMTRPEEERLAAQDNTKLESADLQMSRVLSSRNYETVPGSRTANYSIWHRPRPFTILGIPENASDDLIIWAYQRQIVLEHDQPAQVAKLMTALENIQQQRQSEKLSSQVAIERSMGRWGEQTIAEAYRSLGISPSGDADDETIIGTFAARLDDAPAQERDMRLALLAIGESRNSKRLIDYANNTVSTYEDALKFLEANESTEDNFIPTLYLTKVVDNSANVEMARKAIRLITDFRNSDLLRKFITDDYQNDTQLSTMDVGEAYAVFNMDDRTIDDESLFTVYELSSDDGVVNRDKLLQAITVIAEDRNSTYLRTRLNIPEGQQQPDTLSNEPVGLDNIGNTCYLNSLLQSLFTITTVREIVLDFDHFKQDLNDPEINLKRVGQRSVTIKEIKSSQSFVVRLAELFTQMITTHTRTIRPTPELARLTLETDLAKARRNSTIKTERRPTLGMIDERPIIGPVPRPADSNIVEMPIESPEAVELPNPLQQSSATLSAGAAQMNGTTFEMQRDEDDDSSEKTLVSQTNSVDGSSSPVRSGGKPSQDLEMTDDQVLIPSVEVSGQEADPVKASNESEKDKPLPKPVSSSPQEDKPFDGADHIQPIYKPPPGPPPPIPPRPVAMGILEEYARQQDVTEVLSHAIVQLSCAIRGIGVDGRGEQIEEVHDTFHGEEQRLVLRGSASPQPPLTFLFLNLPIINEPKDIYGAFDNYFDAEDVGGSERYNVITRLPPVLCFSLIRSVQGPAQQGQTPRNIKLDYHVEVPTTLFMDRYMAEAKPGPLLQRRIQMWQYKKELRALKSRLARLEPTGQAPVDEQLATSLAVIQHLAEVGASEKIEGLAMDPEMVSQLAEMPQKVRLEREHVTARIADLEQLINDSFTDAAFRKHEYKLHALFFHRGVASSGHYWIYIYDHVQEIWRKYNDENVSQVINLKEIFGNPHNDRSNPNWSSYSPATPYFMMYVKNDQLKANAGQEIVVETVKRNPIAPSPSAAPAPSSDMSWTNQTVNDEGVDIRPLGSETPTDGAGYSTHHEFSGQPSQMSYMPPTAPRLQGQEPQSQQDQDYASIGSVMQQNRPSTQHARQVSWDETQMNEAIERSLQPNHKEAQWDNSENPDHRGQIW